MLATIRQAGASAPCFSARLDPVTRDPAQPGVANPKIARVPPLIGLRYGRLKSEGKLIEALGVYLNTPDQRWDLNKLAKTAGMSRTRFIEEFKALTGWTPGRLISRLRFAEARRRMLTENLSVESAGEIAGYSSADAC